MQRLFWLKVQDQVAFLLVLEETRVMFYRVSSSLLGLQKNIDKAVAALNQGGELTTSGSKLMKSIDLASISRFWVAPNNMSITIFGDGEKPAKILFTPQTKEADAIYQVIAARTGKTFEASKEEIGVFEALIGPIVALVLVGIFWGMLYHNATELAAGNAIEIGERNRVIQELLAWLAGFLGVNGTLALGAVLLIPIVAETGKQIISRPERTVYLPALR